MRKKYNFAQDLTGGLIYAVGGIVVMIACFYMFGMILGGRNIFLPLLIVILGMVILFIGALMVEDAGTPEPKKTKKKNRP